MIIMSEKLIEKIETPVRYDCDVCVCGGGVAGIAAALAAARQGAKTMLIERGYMLGGLATAGIVTIYLGIDDGLGHQVSYGLAEELFRLSFRHGYEDLYPAPWLENGSVEERAKLRYQIQFNPQLFAIDAEALLLKEGVKILYGAYAVAADVKDGKIKNIVIEGKSGREAISVGRSVVDATGDADICVLAGEETKLYAPGNALAYWYYGYGQDGYNLNMCGASDISGPKDNEEASDPKYRYSGVSTEENSSFLFNAHSALLKNILKKREKTPDLIPVTVATTPQFRMTRRIVGVSEIVNDTKAQYDDSVGLYSCWYRNGYVYELPFSALYGKAVKNLITAGRNISADDFMWNVTRVIPVCAVSGEAAGIAASMTDCFENIDIRALQDKLVSNGVLLHYPDFGETND